MAVTDEHQKFFQWLIRPGTNVLLLEVTLEGKLTSALCVHQTMEDGSVLVKPKLVFVTDDMEILDPDGEQPYVEVDGEVVSERPAPLELGGGS